MSLHRVLQAHVILQVVLVHLRICYKMNEFRRRSEIKLLVQKTPIECTSYVLLENHGVLHKTITIILFVCSTAPSATFVMYRYTECIAVHNGNIVFRATPYFSFVSNLWKYDLVHTRCTSIRRYNTRRAQRSYHRKRRCCIL